MTDCKRPATTAAVSASERVTERLNAVYGDDGAASALDDVFESLQFLSLPADDTWDQPETRHGEPTAGKDPSESARSLGSVNGEEISPPRKI